MYIMRITNLLNFLGMNPKMKGYQYSRCAVELLLGQPHPPEIESIYEQVAQKFGTNSSCVERNIRYAIEITWEKGYLNGIFTVFGYTVSQDRGKPTNREFLFMLAERIKTNTDKVC